MNPDNYRARMEAEHHAFVTRVVEMLDAYGRTQTVFGDTLDAIETHISEMRESQDEMKRLILEQGATLQEQAGELRALRARLEGQ